MIRGAETFCVNVWDDDEYHYAAAYGFMPKLHAYLHEDGQKRPFMLVVPGGGYCMVCNPEGETVGEAFFEMGVNVAVLTYTTDITMSVPLRTQPAEDLSRAIRLIRANSERYRMDPEKLMVSGFSAGGHLCATIATHYADVVDRKEELNRFSNRPDAVILGYPVITSGEFTHIYSIQALIGTEPSEEELTYYSLEKQVHKDMPPCFLWQTVTDNLVPIENTMLMAESLRKAGVPYAYYAFPRGWHGLSTASERMRKGDFGEPYTMEQLEPAIQAVKERRAVNVSEKRRTELMMQFFGNPEGEKRESEEPPRPPMEMPAFDDVALWPRLAEVWLKDLQLL